MTVVAILASVAGFVMVGLMVLEQHQRRQMTRRRWALAALLLVVLNFGPALHFWQLRH